MPWPKVARAVFLSRPLRTVPVIGMAKYPCGGLTTRTFALLRIVDGPRQASGMSARRLHAAVIEHAVMGPNAAEGGSDAEFPHPPHRRTVAEFELSPSVGQDNRWRPIGARRRIMLDARSAAFKTMEFTVKRFG
jgi:hypothetical protein